MMGDKDRPASLANLLGLVDHWFLLELNNVPRAASTQALTENLAALGESVKATGDIADLMRGLIAQTQPKDRILVFGSFFTVAAALTYMQADSQASRGFQ